MIESARPRMTAGSSLILLGMCLLSMIWLLPFVSVILTALRSQGDMMMNGVFTWPEEFLWSNFVKAWDVGDFSIYFRNSLFIIAMKVPLGILLASLAAYPLAKM